MIAEELDPLTIPQLREFAVEKLGLAIPTTVTAKADVRALVDAEIAKRQSAAKDGDTVAAADNDPADADPCDGPDDAPDLTPITRCNEDAWWCPLCDHSMQTRVTVCAGCHAKRDQAQDSDGTIVAVVIAA